MDEGNRGEGGTAAAAAAAPLHPTEIRRPLEARCQQQPQQPQTQQQGNMGRKLQKSSVKKAKMVGHKRNQNHGKHKKVAGTTTDRVGCRKCAYAKNKQRYNKAHNDDCPKSNAFKKREKTASDERQRAAMQEMLRPQANPTVAAPTAPAVVVTGPTAPAVIGTGQVAAPAGPTGASNRRQLTLSHNTAYDGSVISREKLTKVVKDEDTRETVKALYGGVLPENARRKRPPPQIASVIHYLVNEVLPTRLDTGGPVNAKKAEWLQQHQSYHDGMVAFRMPRQDQRYTKDPDYAVVEGVTVYFARWELYDKEIKLCCRNVAENGCACKGVMKPLGRFSFMKNKGVATPVYSLDTQAPVDWIVSMIYTCSVCKGSVEGCEGEILQQLPLPLRLAWPVAPKFAIGKRCHMSRSFSAVAESLIRTHGNGDMISKLYYRLLGVAFEDKEIRHYGLREAVAGPLPAFEDFFGTYGPTGNDIRTWIDDAFRSTLNETEIDDLSRTRREVQSVTSESYQSHDDTFQIGKNYYRFLTRFPGGCASGIAVSTGEMGSVVLAPDTSFRSKSHQISAFANRPGVKPVGMSTDTCPHNSDKWARYFPGITLVLGLFHFLQRMTRVMRSNHVDYACALQELKDCIYSINKQDWENFTKAMLDGTLNGKPVSHDEFQEMKKKPGFMKQYGRYLRKEFHGARTVTVNLKEWWRRFKVKASEGQPAAGGRLDPTSNRPLFMQDAKEVFQQLEKKAKYVNPDSNSSLSSDKMYLEVRPSSKSRHRLSTYKSLVGTESFCESYWDSQCQFANVGTNESLCDSINHGGLAEHNVKMRHRFEQDSLDDEQRDNVPFEFRRQPRHWNHSRLALINELARACGVLDDRLPHGNLRSLPADNGERFYSEYLHMEAERQKERPEGDYCMCAGCIANDTRRNQTTGLETAASAMDTDTTVGATDETQALHLPVEDGHHVLDIPDAAHAKIPETTTAPTVAAQHLPANSHLRQLQPTAQLQPLAPAPPSVRPRLPPTAQMAPTTGLYAPPYLPMQAAGLYHLLPSFPPFPSRTMGPFQFNPYQQTQDGPAFCCEPKRNYDLRRMNGETKGGRPPHSKACRDCKPKTSLAPHM